jgi:ribose transport system permease protein
MTASKSVGTNSKADVSSLRSMIERNITFLGPLATLIILTALFAILAPGTFLSSGNIVNVMSQVSVLAILAAGLTFVLLLGQIDLSVAAVAVLAGMVSAIVYSGLPITFPFLGPVTFGGGNQWIAILLAGVIACLVGLLSGILTAKFGIPSFIGTLGVLEMARGLAFYWSDGQNIYEIAPLSNTLGSSFIGPIPVIVIVAAVTLLVGHFVLTWTRFGRYVYMVGANPKAAQLSGVPVRRVTIMVFVISGALAGFAGIVLMGRVGSAQATSGDNLLLPAIAAVVLGGTSLFGGVGSMKHTAVGLLLYGVLNNGLDQIDVNIYLKPFARGAFLLAAIALNIAALRMANRARTRSDVGSLSDEMHELVNEPMPHTKEPLTTPGLEKNE